MSQPTRDKKSKLDDLYSILRGMIREEIDQTPGFRELTGESKLPANVYAEKTILGAILLDNAAHSEVAEKIVADEFSLDSHRRIFVAMCALKKEVRPIDLITLQEHMGTGIKEIGGAAYLFSLTEGLPRRPVIEEYIRIVQEKAKLRRIMAGCIEAIKKCQQQQETAAEIVKQLGIAVKGIK